MTTNAVRRHGSDGSAVREVVQVVTSGRVTVRPQVFPLRRIVDDTDFRPSAGPRHMIGMDAVFDVVDRVGLGARRPRIAFVAEAGDVPLRVFPGFTHSTIGHSVALSVRPD